MARATKRSQEQVFTELYTALRKFRKDTPASHERVDPILRMLLQAYAHEVVKLESDLVETWDVAKSALLKTVCGHAGRWPTPAHCVMECSTVDPVVEVDAHTRFFYRGSREGARTYFFSPLTDWPVLGAATESVILRNGDFVLPVGKDSVERELRAAIEQKSPEGQDGWQLYVSFSYTGPPSALNGAVLYLDVAADIRPQLQWGYWHPLNQPSGTSGFSFCPGHTSWLDRVITPAGADDWGGLRTSENLLSDLVNAFVVLPEDISSRWKAGPPPPELVGHKMPYSDEPILSDSDKHYWLRIDLPSRGNRTPFGRGVNLAFNAIVAANRYTLTLFRHTGGTRLIDVVLPEDAESILTIENVVDSDGQVYTSSDSGGIPASGLTYTVTERDGHVILWFDFTQSTEPVPNSISIEYTVTDGIDANGIEPDRITRMYEGHPGLSEVRNLTPTTGAIPARTREQLEQEVTVRLRQRDRALTFEDVSAWSRAFDPRVQEAQCVDGVRRIDGRVLRCIIVSLTVDPEAFGSEDEIELLKSRLERFLKMRSVINTQYIVEVNQT